MHGACMATTTIPIRSEAHAPSKAARKSGKGFSDVIVGHLKLGQHRRSPLAVSVISLGELAAGMDDAEQAPLFLSRFRVMPLKSESALTGALVDRALMIPGGRLGENDTWIAGCAASYGLTLASNSEAFARVRSLRLLRYG